MLYAFLRWAVSSNLTFAYNIIYGPQPRTARNIRNARANRYTTNASGQFVPKAIRRFRLRGRFLHMIMIRLFLKLADCIYIHIYYMFNRAGHSVLLWALGPYLTPHVFVHAAQWHGIPYCCGRPHLYWKQLSCFILLLIYFCCLFLLYILW